MSPPDPLAMMLAQIEPGPDGDRKVLLVAIEHLVAATRTQVETGKALVDQVGQLTDRIHELALTVTEIETRNEQLPDHEARLRKLEENAGASQAERRLIDWLFKNWASLAALGAAIWAIFGDRKAG